MKKPSSMTAAAALAWLCLTLILAGCGSNEPNSVTLSGQLAHAENTPVSDNASARISVVEKGEGGDDNRIVAERSLHNIGEEPIQFDIDVARNLIDPEGNYGLRAEIIGADGSVRWVSRQAVPIEPLQREKPVTIKLEPAATESELAFNKYRCGDGFHLSAAKSRKKAVVRLGNRRLVLKSAKDGRNLKYADEHGNTLQVNDIGLAFHVDGEQHSQCRIVADQTPVPDTVDETSVGSRSVKPAEKAVASTSMDANSRVSAEPSVSEQAQ